MAFSYSPKIVTDGLVLYLDAANPYSYVSGSTTWNDLSRSQLSGSLISGPTFDTGSGGNIVFDGTNDYISMVQNTSLRPNSLTLSCWAKPQTSATTEGRVLAGYSDVIGWQYGYALFMYPYSYANQINAFIGDGTTPTYIQYPITVDTWYNFVLTYNGTTAILYSNGVNVGSYNKTLTYTGSNQFSIGKGHNYTGTYKGSLGVTQLYDRVLSSAEVLQNFNAMKGRFGL